ncbi:SusC/RagA family TonB-linked outer membrane protein [Chitinophaga filiformis]|uniref:SusC/RagA family TonB-linked outer membrane protein n=1 Tax=Chitinophaga filiformis TaxID=104663 RepID=UPI001F29A531|nr:SusC/RagA family TonB-linked outer membrane protein [Chitinophaga filiformis]MCF6401240.1 SusC/RagA family TonB-linked outer membrane protein [Chitinophaga filiformis]
MDISTPRSNLVVRFLSVFLLCCNSLYASTDQTGKQKVTVVGNDVTLETVFKQIEKQTGLRFMYAVDAVDVKERVTVAFDKVMLDDVLESLLGKKGVEWVYREETISLKTRGKNGGSEAMIADPTSSISGRILDAKGEPVPGATVAIKGSKRGAKADADGNFILSGVKLDDVLLISSIGFETIEVTVKSRNIVVRMRQVIGNLDERIIIGYGTTTTRLNLGNVTSIKADEIVKNPVSDPILALQGRVPGLVISQTTGLAGGRLNIQIRGRNSIDNGTQPLFVVDGVPYQPTITAPLGGNYGALGNVVSALNFLNPADIESIDILKDADATAIYGSRGANGVVLITTKKGRIGTTRIDVNISQGIQNITRWKEMLNTPQYLEVRREAFKNDNILPDSKNAPDLMLWDTARYTDWQKVLVGGTAQYSDLQANVSGGVTTVQYLLGGNYHRETTIYPGDFASQRGGGHFSIIGNSQDQRFKAALTGNYILGRSNFPGGDFARQTNLPPNAPAVYSSNGALNWENSTWENPYAQLEGKVSDSRTVNMVTNIDLSYQVLPNFIIKGNIGYNELRLNVFNATLIAGVDPALQRNARASSIYVNNKTGAWISEPQASYSLNFGKNTVNIIGGATLLMNKEENQVVGMRGIKEDALVRKPGAATSFSVTNSGIRYKYAAFFGRVGYNFSNKYLFNLTFRRDGSSRFGPRKRFANFGSLGAGWIFSEEKYIQSNVPILSFGKVRGSYGITGNDQVGDYRYLNQYEFSEQPYAGEKGLKVAGLYNPDFTWEQTKKFETGLELGFLKNRVFFATSYYVTRSSNQLLLLALPIMTGDYSVTGNLPATIRNTGVEFVVNSENIKLKKIEWSTSLNLTAAKSKLVSYNKDYYSNNYVREGGSLSNKYLYKSLGVNETTGDFQFADAEGKPTYDYQADIYAASVDLNPKFYGGIQNHFRYGSFSLDVLFQFVKQTGFKGLYSGEALPGTGYNQPLEVQDRWHKPGDASFFQRMSLSSFSSYNAFLSSDQAYGDASFIRCKNISFSWIGSDKILRLFHLKGLRIYLQGQNIFTVTKYRGWDPETQTAISIPPLRVLTMGLHVTL